MSLGIKREHDFKTFLPYYKRDIQMILKRCKIGNREKYLSFIANTQTFASTSFPIMRISVVGGGYCTTQGNSVHYFLKKINY